MSMRFQSTRPVGDATDSVQSVLDTLLFQSTRPVGDATSEVIQIMARKIFQSTRPVGDATDSPEYWIEVIHDFNPRVPWGTRPDKGVCRQDAVQISIHASRGGRDADNLEITQEQAISIHASRGGRD